MADDTSQREASGPIDTDLHCLECRYNLRGLSGDPVRCPECFHEYSVAELRAAMTKRTISREERIQRHLETAGKLCALPVGVSLLVAPIGFLAPEWFRYVRMPFFSAAGVTWLMGLLLFFAKCRTLSGWVLVLIKYNMWVVPAAMVNFLIVCLGLFFSSALGIWLEATGPSAFWFGLLLGIGGVVFVLAYVRPMRGLTRRGRDALEPLARELAKRAP